jgi:hypothetical protein
VIVFAYHYDPILSLLLTWQYALSYDYLKLRNRKQLDWRSIMTENKTEDYFDDNDDGHVDTREQNFECENPDEHLGCDLGIDVQG